MTRWFGVVLLVVAAAATRLAPLLDRIVERHPEHRHNATAWSNITVLTATAGVALLLGAPAWVCWINSTAALAIGTRAAWRQRAGIRRWWPRRHRAPHRKPGRWVR